jgi:hypothetical protein
MPQFLRKMLSLAVLIGMKFAYGYLEDKKMQTVQDINYQKQIDEALKRAKYKKVLYIYDDSGHKRLLGVFSKKTAVQIKKYLERQNLINRLTEYDIKTTEPDSQFL